ncbi:anthocyanidin 3-O-galactosyltransferase F3GT1-like [Diospyros lotus]|uniref:anthocyanidin 3-O-galactosyltransferase F3GT1-like n=1 Tax=Diospyros lotus TaxID=55363 RepID=UPI00225B6E84|nr:anthocyanidin 3-O-galactosyltransferase F3GT1-like [Diospyros lotus]
MCVCPMYRQLSKPQSIGTRVPMADSSPHLHVAVLAFPFSSHPGSLLRIVCRLAAAAPDVTFSFYTTEESNKSLFSVPAPPNLKAFHLSDGVPEGYVFSGKPQEAISLFLEAGYQSCKKAVQAAEAEIGRRISCLMADAFLWFSCDLAEEMGVAWIPVRTGGVLSLSVHVYTDLIRDTVGINALAGREDEIVKFIPGFSGGVRLGDLPSGVLFGNLDSAFAVMLHKMGKVLRKAKFLAVNSFEGLESEASEDLNFNFTKLLYIGPLNLTCSAPATGPSSFSDEYGCLQWLDSQKPGSVAYIGFGTVGTPAPDELVELANALEARATPFLWSIKDSLKKHLPEKLLERINRTGKMVPWTPQVQVLAHVSIGVFITHFGWKSVMESITAGVPLIGRPIFAEQHLNGWVAEHVWRIGVKVGVLRKDATIRALDLVLLEEGGKKLKENAEWLKELAHKAAGKNGSSTRNFDSLVEFIRAQKNLQV